MIGHAALLKLRTERKKPAAVFVQILDEIPAYNAWDNLEQSLQNQPFASIDVMPNESPELLDFPGIRGLRVHLHGTDLTRVVDLIDRMTEFEPVQIIAAGFSPDYLIDWTPDLGLVELEIA